MDDPLFQALRDPKDPEDEPDTTHRHTDRSHPVTELMASLRDQALSAVSGDFFDAEVDAEVLPVRTVMRSQAETLRVHARRREPPYEVDVEFEVRSDREAGGPGGQYTVRGSGTVRCARRRGAHAEFRVTPSVRDDGTLEIDAANLRRRIATAIRQLGTSAPG